MVAPTGIFHFLPHLPRSEMEMEMRHAPIISILLGVPVCKFDYNAVIGVKLLLSNPTLDLEEAVRDFASHKMLETQSSSFGPIFAGNWTQTSWLRDLLAPMHPTNYSPMLWLNKTKKGHVISLWADTRNFG
jgi:hypothetical protein